MTEQTVLTTGANSGIGLQTVIEIAKLGYRSVGSVRSDAKADAMVAAAEEAGVTVEPVILDVADAAECEAVMDGLDLYGLVNNAGYSNGGAVEDVDDEDVRQQFETMVIAPMRLARLALPSMRAAGAGRVVNVSSIFGRTTTPLTGWYQATKHALEAVSDALRMEVAGAGVRVILVEPGGFRTEIWEDNQNAIARHEGSAYVGAYDREEALLRLTQPFLGDPARVAKVVGRALRTRAPRARYLVGPDAHALALIDRVSPTSVKDMVTRIGFGL